MHRDLKSLNILLGKHLEAKVSDFGLSRVKQETMTSTINNKTAQAVGTLAWMAPELFSRKPKYTKASDVYSFAMILWEIASGEVPYQGCQAFMISQYAIQGDREDIPDETPKSFAKLIKWCWQGKPEARATMAEAVEYLEDNQVEVANMVK